MGAVHVGIRHNNNLMITQLTNIKIFMNPGSESRNHGFDLRICIDLIQPCLFHIQNLSAKRKDCLGCAVAGRFGGTAGGISLHDIDLAIHRILVGTVCQLSGKG